MLTENDGKRRMKLVSTRHGGAETLRTIFALWGIIIRPLIDINVQCLLQSGLIVFLRKRGLGVEDNVRPLNCSPEYFIGSVDS